MKRFARALIVLAVSAMITTGFVSTASAHDRKPNRGHHKTVAVVVGDSYASGVGAGNYDPVSGECLRSANAWSQQLSGNYRVTNLACSGATTVSVLTTQVPNIDPKADVVFVQVGGNPAFGAVVGCALDPQTDCTEQSPYYQYAAGVVTQQLGGELDELYAAIKQRVPRAKIVAVGYPAILPVNENPGTCTYLSPGEVALVNKFMINALTPTIRAAAARNGAQFIDPTAKSSPFVKRNATQNACSGSKRAFAWSVNPALPQNEWFHPTALGQQLLALTVKQGVH